MKQGGVPEPPKPRKEPQKGVLLPVICAAICVGALLGMVLMLAGDKEDPVPQVQVIVPAATEAKAEKEPAKAAEAEETEALKKTSAEESKVDPYSAELPDLEDFLDTEYTQDEWGYTHYVTCLVDDDDAVDAVLDLLLEPRYQLKLMDKDSDSDGTHYTYEYTGKNEDIDWVYLKAGGQYHVKLTVKPYGSSQTAIIMYSFPEFYLEDPDVRWDGSGSTSGNSGSSSSGSSSSSSSSGSSGSSSSGTKIKVNCTKCFGDGDVTCSNCSGAGYKIKRESVPNYSGSTSGSKWAETKETCFKCHGSGEVTCSRCGGSGKQ